MSYQIAAHSDVGIAKNSNQDSVCIKEAKTIIGNIIMAIVCDGMGGLSKGELASASVVIEFSRWFEEELPRQIMLKDYENDIKLRWNEIIQLENEKIGTYGNKNKIQLGTTLTILLIIDNKKYLIGHVGDSRVYRLNDFGIFQLTEDQTVVASEVKAGRMTEEQAAVDPRRSVLLQCVGASNNVKPAILEGEVEQNDMFLMCSDGFRHEVSSDEIYEKLRPREMENETVMKEQLVQLTEIVKSRRESDNISSLVIKVI